MWKRWRTRAHTKASRFSQQVSLIVVCVSFSDTVVQKKTNFLSTEQRGRNAAFPETVNMFVQEVLDSTLCMCGKSLSGIW